ncbi:hypothetical protein EV715DRAFT_298212 [Schizophyllum commune]
MRGLYFGISGVPEPPEACAGSLGDGRNRGRILPTPEPPEASAGSPDEEYGKGGIPHPRAGQGGGAASPLTPGLRFLLVSNRRRHARAPSGEGSDRGGLPLPTRAGPWRGAASSWTLISLIFAVPQPPEACARALGEECGRGGLTLTPHGALVRAQKSGGTAPFVEGSFLLVPRRSAPPFKRLETDIFDEKDSSPSSLPTSSRFMPTSQLSTTLNDA